MTSGKEDGAAQDKHPALLAECVHTFDRWPENTVWLPAGGDEGFRLSPPDPRAVCVAVLIHEPGGHLSAFVAKRTPAGDVPLGAYTVVGATVAIVDVRLAGPWEVETRGGDRPPGEDYWFSLLNDSGGDYRVRVGGRWEVPSV